MRFAHISRRQAEAMTDEPDWDDVFAVQDVQEGAVMRGEHEDLRRSAEMDRLLQDVEHKLVTAQRIEAGRQRVNATDRQSPRRLRRRAGRTVLRSLPGRVPASVLVEVDSEAA